MPWLAMRGVSIWWQPTHPPATANLWKPDWNGVSLNSAAFCPKKTSPCV
ncbi:MAG TPA: hypothetical protein VHO28_13315 [Ignavibacteriales bacterium]|nr:hypothetical protein [Ignavibacteriales bacterium]